MNGREEQLMKEKLYQDQINKCPTGSAPLGGTLRGLGACGYNAIDPKRPCLSERVAEDLRRAERESHKRDRLAELVMLLDKNPEVARILDLLEDVRG